jgi:serine/threonine protein kinase
VRHRPSEPLPSFPGFEVIEELSAGVGGMGRVFKAREKTLDRIVALKMVTPRLNTREGIVYFEREAQAAARLDHPNILKVFGFHPEHEPPFFVMQYLEGRSIAQACRGRHFEFIAGMVEKVGRSLSYAHERGVIHRDIKPDNLLVDQRDEPFVCDFGVAGRVENSGEKAGSATLVGTPAFIAPEVYAGASEVGPAVDIYGLGATLYQLLTGRAPFAGDSPDAIRQQVVSNEPPVPTELNPSAPEALQRICLKAMERDREARYESAGQMADDLRRFLEGHEVLAKPTRYTARLRGRLENHLADLRLWFEQRLIDVRELDRLSRPYHLIIDSESPWTELSSRFPWESLTLRLGGFLVLVSSILWPAFYWHRLTRTERVWAIGAPALVINFVGWYLRSRGSRANSLVYLSTGALLIPLWVSIVLSEYHVWPHTQSAMAELLSQPGPETQNAYAPTNLQLTISAFAFTAYCLIVLIATRGVLLAFLIGAGVYLTCSGLLLIGGLKQWVMTEHIARALSCYVLVALLFCPIALALEKLRQGRKWAAIFYSMFPLPAALFVSLLARRYAIERFGWDPGGERVYQAWMVAGVVFLLAALWSGRSSLSYVRFWGAILLLLVPLHLLSPTQVLFARAGHDLFKIGDAPVTTYELASGAIAIALILLGVDIRQNALVLPALLGLGIFFVRATERHFKDYLSWPTGLALMGTVAMIGALVSLAVRARRGREKMI